MSVPDSIIVPVVIGRWLFADIVIGAISIVVVTVPMTRAKNHCADQALPTNPPVVAGPPMPGDKKTFDNAREKK